MRTIFAHLLVGAFVVAGAHSGPTKRLRREIQPDYQGPRLLQDDTAVVSIARSWLEGANPPLSEEQASQALPLVLLYVATNGGAWTTSDNWLSYTASICQWYNQKDVEDRCDPTGQTLIELELSENGLNGFLPTGIGGLSLLDELDLEDNAIGGSLPSEIATMVMLDELDLSKNALVGPLPTELGTMTNIEHVYLGENSMTGTIPVELGGMSSLEDLDLSDNLFEGLSFPTQLLQLTNLETISFYNNKNLAGPIPPALFLMPNLEEVELAYNNFYGTIPSTIGLSTTLEYISLKNNAIAGTIPYQVFHIATLEELRLDDNRLVGTIPSNIPLNTKLIEMQLDENALTGPIPSQIGNLLSLEVLKLEETLLSGTVPVELTKLVNLTELDMNYTLLVGAIPAPLCGIKELSFQCRPGIGLCGCGCPCPPGVVPATGFPVATPAPAPVPSATDPTNQNCNQDFGGNEYPCLDTNYPVCRGYVSGKSWGKCFAAPAQVTPSTPGPVTPATPAPAPAATDPSNQNCIQDYNAGNQYSCIDMDYPVCQGHVSGKTWGKCFAAAAPAVTPAIPAPTTSASAGDRSSATDPFNQNCNQDYNGGNESPCLNINYPVCQGHVSGKTWGKCFAQPVTGLASVSRRDDWP